MRSLPLAAILLSLQASPVAAETPLFDAGTTCAEVRAIFDAPNPDLQRVRSIFEAVDRSLEAFDRLYEAHGMGRILPRMSVEGRRNTAATVTARCDKYPKDTIQMSAFEVYRGLRAMQKALGNKGQ